MQCMLWDKWLRNKAEKLKENTKKKIKRITEGYENLKLLHGAPRKSIEKRQKESHQERKTNSEKISSWADQPLNRNEDLVYVKEKGIGWVKISKI